MPDRLVLASAFIKTDAADAAATLQSAPASEIASLLAQLEAVEAARLLERLPARAAGETLRQLDEAKAAELVHLLAPRPAAQMLRQTDEARRQAILSELARPQRLRIDFALRQARNTVGAASDPRVIALLDDVPASSALDRLRQEDNAVPVVFVTDAAHRARHGIAVSALLRADPGTVLGELPAVPSPAIRANATLAAAAQHAGWHEADWLVVEDSNGALVGVLRHADLLSALESGDEQDLDANPPDALLEMVGAVSAGMADVMKATIARPALPDGRSAPESAR